MNCAELEILLCDYVDGTISAAERAALEGHMAGCPSCARLASDVLGMLAFLEKVPVVDPPSGLVSRIFEQIPARRPWWRKPLEVMLQPRFAMGLAMTLLSASMLVRLGHVETRELSRADADPMKVWQTLDDQTYRVWDRTVKYYDEMPLVMDLQSQWKDWQEQNQDQSDR